jgi:hypothetical protein
MYLVSLFSTVTTTDWLEVSSGPRPGPAKGEMAGGVAGSTAGCSGRTVLSTLGSAGLVSSDQYRS